MSGWLLAAFLFLAGVVIGACLCLLWVEWAERNLWREPPWPDETPGRASANGRTS
jgi:hypothetical protein